jgi:putative nucleotidyltransferase with HDIG domain
MSIELMTDELVETPHYTTTLDELLFDAGELAALPQVILKLIDLTADPKVSAADVERVIQTDQGTTARVLTLANSSYYGLPRRISSVKEAVVFLGFKTVRNLAMTVSSFNMFLGRSDDASLSRRNLWRHSLNTALCTRVVCSKLSKGDAVRVDTQDAFTAGLLHDIGKMALDSALPKQYVAAQAEAARTGQRLYHVETLFLPYTHAVIGSAMADRWSLPDLLCDSILNHHTPMDSQVNSHLAAVVALANEISQGFTELTVEVEGEEPVQSSFDDAATVLGFTAEAVRTISEACKSEMEKGLALNA